MAAGRIGVADERADDFAGLFAACYDDMLRLAYLLCGDRQRAEDAACEAFAKMYPRWRKGGIDKPRAYLRRAVVNEVNSRFRRLALERREAARRSGDRRGAVDPDDAVAERNAMLAALQQLPGRQRTAVVLRYYHDLSERETAEVMGTTVGTVKSNTARGLDRLRALLGDAGEMSH